MTSQSRRSNSREKTLSLCRLLRGFGRVAIAFSGGADSSFLLRSAIDALGTENVLALHARSCLQSKIEQERAAFWPERHSIPAARLRLVEFSPLKWQEFVCNPSDRCYFCKRRMYQRFQTVSAEEGFAVLLDGSNADDLEQGEAGRPGLRAIAELGVRSPLADCGFTKAEIRDLSRKLRLHTWDQPASSCLATRIPQGMKITAARLEQVAALEQVLTAADFLGCRVRILDEITICVQLRQKDMDRFCLPEHRTVICSLVKKKGVKNILLDLNGR